MNLERMLEVKNPNIIFYKIIKTTIFKKFMIIIKFSSKGHRNQQPNKIVICMILRGKQSNKQNPNSDLPYFQSLLTE